MWLCMVYINLLILTNCQLNVSTKLLLCLNSLCDSTNSYNLFYNTSSTKLLTEQLKVIEYLLNSSKIKSFYKIILVHINNCLLILIGSYLRITFS